MFVLLAKFYLKVLILPSSDLANELWAGKDGQYCSSIKNKTLKYLWA